MTDGAEKQRVGLTTTIPVEILYAAGLLPVDLNNLFVAGEQARDLVTQAERRGFPQNACAWVKGLYATARAEKITRIVGVIEGDCSQNAALLDIWQVEGMQVIPFSFPARYTLENLSAEMQGLATMLGTNMPRAEACKIQLDEIRALTGQIDALAVARGCVTSRELFLAQLALTDFNGDPQTERTRQANLLAQAQQRPTDKSQIRLGVVGVPTILTDLWEVIESAGGRVMYHEVPQQFSLAWGVGKTLPETFLDYTYSRPAAVRVREVARQVRERDLAGVIHYVQSFCHRQIHDMVLRQELSVPVLTVEADRPGAVDGRTRTRIEAFLEQLSH